MRVIPAAEILANIKERDTSVYYGNYDKCPKCKAKKFEACKALRGRKDYLKHPHRERPKLELAEREEP